MGVFTVPIKLRNWQNRYLPLEEQGEEVECEAIVDSGAVQLALPAEIIERLKLEYVEKKPVIIADGSRHKYRVFGIVEVEVQGRTSRVQAIEIPKGSQPLLGAIPLEEMDWHISPNERKLLPNPLSPNEALLPMVAAV